MKAVTLIFVLVVSSLSVSATSLHKVIRDDAVFDGVITNIDNGLITTRWDTPDRHEDCKGKETHSLCRHMERGILLVNWKYFTEWHWQSTPQLTRPVKQAVPVVGQLLKGRWDGDSFHAVESCEVRSYKIAIQMCGDPPDYCRPPMNLQPYDCTRSQSDFIANLLGKLKG